MPARSAILLLLHLAMHKISAKYLERVVKTDEERDVLGDEPPANGEDADGARRYGIGKEQDESALRDAVAAGRRREVEQHVEENHAPHDRVPIGLCHAESLKKARNDGVNEHET